MIAATGCDPNFDQELDEWPEDYDAILTKVITDPAGDISPDMISADLTEVAMGVDGGYLYVRTRWAATTPTSAIDIPPTYPGEQRAVTGHSLYIQMTWGRPDGRGLKLGVELEYDDYPFFDEDCVNAIAETGNDPFGDSREAYEFGEYGEGGPGADCTIVRYALADLGAWFPRGQTVQIDFTCYARAEDLSDDYAVFDKYAPDGIESTTWLLP
jgi:hypothetical protein